VGGMLAGAMTTYQFESGGPLHARFSDLKSPTSRIPWRGSTSMPSLRRRSNIRRRRADGAVPVNA
jgi:hypothetical protein